MNMLKRIKTTRHGMYGTRPYNIWTGIKRRCFNKNDITYQRYGAVGISMCDKWKNGFMFFWEDMKDSYFNTAQIDRIDNNKGYSKNNCRWVTLKQQANNKKSVILYTYNGETMNIMDWGKKMGIKSETLRARLNIYKWPLEQALTIKTNYANKFIRPKK